MWEIFPFEGVGPLRFGMLIENINIRYGEPEVVDRGIPGGRPIYHYFGYGIHAEFDSCTGLDYIIISEAASLPFQHPFVVYQGTAFIGRKTADVVAEMSERGYVGDFNYPSYEFKSIGLSVYAPGREEYFDIVDSIGLFRRKADMSIKLTL